MIDEIRKNVDTEIEILREISNYTRAKEKATPQENVLLDNAINSSVESMRLINNSIPFLVKEISLIKELPSTSARPKKMSQSLEKVTYVKNGKTGTVLLPKAARESFLKELVISESLLKRMKKEDSTKKELLPEYRAPRGYLKLANRAFLKRATDMVKQKKFGSLARELKRSNLDMLLESYIAMMFFTSLLSVFVGIAVMIVFMFFNVSPLYPFFSLYEGSLLLRLLKIFWIPIVIPLATFGIVYSYPSAEKRSIEKRINQELPFAVIHMSAISGSGIAPSEIFRIIGLSREYPTLRKEVRKILNQINLYGYDLITALQNAAESSPSQKLSELFLGVAASITSGTNLNDFFEKRAETLMISYRLERENYTKIAETFMDIYISVVIAAPMIMMLLLIILSFTKTDMGLTTDQISGLIVIVVAMLNAFFLGFLQVKQPVY